MTDPKPCPLSLDQFVALINALTTHIHGGRFTGSVWSGSLAPWKTLYITFQKAYKNRIKVFLEVPRIRPSQDDDTFDGMLRIASDGSLVEYALKISPHFDADKTELYLKTNEELSKVISTIKTKEQCEQLKLLLALDLRFLNGSDYVWEKPDGTSLPRPTNPMMGLIRYGEADESASESVER